MFKNFKILLFVTLLIPALFFSCTKKELQWEVEMDALTKYLNDSNITVKPTRTGLYYIETQEGDGNQAVSGNLVFVNYTGYFLNGQMFETSEGHDPMSFVLGQGQVIRGWDEGISYMKERGKARLIIPSNLAYGYSGSGTIPPYTTLIFDVELIQAE